MQLHGCSALRTACQLHDDNKSIKWSCSSKTYGENDMIHSPTSIILYIRPCHGDFCAQVYAKRSTSHYILHHILRALNLACSSALHSALRRSISSCAWTNWSTCMHKLTTVQVLRSGGNQPKTNVHKLLLIVGADARWLCHGCCADLWPCW